mmetsp:Transcript_74111/g.149327  ORF Transcript_74111/g.149327 Transcript_74111/m.149327 type:complete len:111 (-) Transcript_74111:878-1210(-)
MRLSILHEWQVHGCYLNIVYYPVDVPATFLLLFHIPPFCFSELQAHYLAMNIDVQMQQKIQIIISAQKDTTPCMYWSAEKCSSMICVSYAKYQDTRNMKMWIPMKAPGSE